MFTIILAILDALFDSPKKPRYTEKELDNWGLNEDEKKVVRNNPNYDPWDFDEEDIDEDSFYGE